MTDPNYFLTESFLHRRIQILSSLADPFFTGYPDPFFLKTTNLDHFFTGSFLHRPIHEPSLATQILSSLVDPRTKLRWPISLLHRWPISLCWFVCVGLFVCGCVSVLIYLCWCICVHLRKTRWGVEVVVHREEREKLVRTEINKIIYTHATVSV